MSSAEATKHKYTMTISRTTVDKLGIKLYDKVSAVLAEIIANSYDADAENVEISLPLGTYLARRSHGKLFDQGHTIILKDDGHGMTDLEINEFYLNVGIDRRKRAQHGSESREKSRPVMGRKGIGKLAPFGICQEVEVISAAGPKDATEFPVAHLILRYEEINTPTDKPYHPDVGSRDGTTTDKRGTTIILRHFGRRRVPKKADLQRQLTARFGLARKDWNVTVKDTGGSGEQFDFGEGELDVSILEPTRIDVAGRPVVVRVPVDDSDPDGEVNERELSVTGWVAYARQPYKDEVMAGVRIYARGKIVSQTRDFNIPTGFTGEFKLRTYLTGQINADWLDDEEDLIRSDRQDIVWNGEVGEAFQQWGQTLLRELAGNAEDSVKSKAWDEFLELSNLTERAKQAFPREEDIRDRVLQIARLAVRGADRGAIQDQDYVNRVVGFSLSVAPHQALLESLHDIASGPGKSLDAVIEVFGQVRLAEMYSLGQVAKEKVDSVQELRKLIATATTEGPLQDLLERAPWLISPQWTPILLDRSLKQLRTNFEDWYKGKYGVEITTSAINRERKEPDFVFVNLPTSLEILEIKKPGHNIDNGEFGRAHGYLSAVRQFLKNNPEIGEKFGKVRLSLVCKSLDKLNDINRDLVEKDEDIAHRSWETILDGAMTVYADYLEAFEQATKASEEEATGTEDADKEETS